MYIVFQTRRYLRAAREVNNDMKSLLKNILMIFLLMIAVVCHAGDDPVKTDDPDLLVSDDTLNTVRLSVETNIENAKVFIDTMFIGLTPVRDYEIPEGDYIIKVFNPKAPKTWESENVVFNTYLSTDTTITIRFNYYYYFNTTPFDAEVFKNDTALGNTPLRFFRDHEMTGNLIFRKKNYRDYVFDLGTYDFEKGADIKLQSKGTETINDVVYKNRGTQFNTKRSLWTIAALSGAAILTGYFAIDFKNKANDEYANYLLSGNTAMLDNSRTNDKYFAISLVLMQAAVGGLIYFLFFD